MIKNLVFAVVVLGVTSSILVNFAMASTDDELRSDRACEEMVTLEGKQDARTEPDSPIPDSDQGSRKAFEGAQKAAGDCL